jgi:hypothetical protein
MIYRTLVSYQMANERRSLTEFQQQDFADPTLVAMLNRVGDADLMTLIADAFGRRDYGRYEQLESVALGRMTTEELLADNWANMILLTHIDNHYREILPQNIPELVDRAFAVALSDEDADSMTVDIPAL